MCFAIVLGNRWLSFMYYRFNPLVSNIFKYHSNRLCSWNYTFACFVFFGDIHNRTKNASYKKELCMLLQSSFYRHLLFVKYCIKCEIAHTLLIQSLRPIQLTVLLTLFLKPSICNFSFNFFISRRN